MIVFGYLGIWSLDGGGGLIHVRVVTYGQEGKKERRKEEEIS